MLLVNSEKQQKSEAMCKDFSLRGIKLVRNHICRNLTGLKSEFKKRQMTSSGMSLACNE